MVEYHSRPCLRYVSSSHTHLLLSYWIKYSLFSCRTINHTQWKLNGISCSNQRTCAVIRKSLVVFYELQIAFIQDTKFYLTRLVFDQSDKSAVRRKCCVKVSIVLTVRKCIYKIRKSKVHNSKLFTLTSFFRRSLR